MSKKKRQFDENEEFLNESENNDENFDSEFSSFLTNVDKDLDTVPENKIVIPTGIDYLDAVMGGGLRCHVSVWVGFPGAGKSALMSSFMKAFQKNYKTPIIVYLDSENSTTEARLNQLRVDGKNVKIINGITIEDVFKTIDKICEYKEKNKNLLDTPTLVIWDSYANTQSESEEKSEELVQTQGAQKVKILSYYLPKVVKKASKYNISFCIINQYNDDIDMNANKYSQKPKELRFARKGKTIPGGNKLRYNSFHMFEVRQTDDLKDTFGFNAVKVEAFAIKNKAFTPNIPISLIFSFAAGTSNFWTNFEMLKEYDYIKTGAWMSLKDCPQPSFRQAEAIKIYRENEDWRNAFNNAVKDCIKINIIEKYTLNEEQLKQIDID